MTNFNIKSAAEYLQCSPTIVYGLIKRGELKAAKLGKSYVIKPEWLDACLESRAEKQQEIERASVVLPLQKRKPLPDLSRYL